MHPKWSYVLSAVAVLSLGAADVAADGMRCGQRLVSKGDTLYAVRAVCGEPDAADRRVVTRSEQRRVRGPCFKGRDGKLQCERIEEFLVDVVIDEWTYDFGTQRFVRYLTFENGSLARVATGSYGYKQDE
jgi:uncharacterized protein DUF2845